MASNRSSSSSYVVPMRGAVIASLLMASAWGVIAGGVGLNALVKSNQQKTRLKKSVKPPTQVTIDTSDVSNSGIVLTAVSAFIASLCTLFILINLFVRRFAVRSLRAQSMILAFCATWLFATLVPFTHFFATRSAKVTAKIGSVQLPPDVVKAAERAQGTTSVYKEIGYLKLLAILPWFALLFTIVASVVLFMAGSPSRRIKPIESGDTSPTDEKHSDHGHEKGTTTK